MSISSAAGTASPLSAFRTAPSPRCRYPSARAFAHDLTSSATMLKGQLAEMMRALFAAG